MKTNRLTSVFAVVAILVFSGRAFGALELVEQNTKTVGATTITWDSSFQDLSYTVGNTITMEVHWQVDAGRATFNNFVLRGPRFTPKGPDPADGELGNVALIQNTMNQGDEGVVEVQFRFTSLHCDAERQVEVGNAHFSLLLDIDQDGDGVLDSRVGYGVNVHVEQPGACTTTSGGPPSGAGGGGRPSRGR